MSGTPQSQTFDSFEFYFFSMSVVILKFFSLFFLLFTYNTLLKMGSGWSKEKTTPSVKTKEQRSIKVEERPTGLEQTGSKRSFASNDSQQQSKKKKSAHFKKKDSWGKKEGGNKKSAKSEESGGLQTRPERLGPREPRIPKKKVALLVGFNGTGYQGMQL
jgi:tRNA pseudouridine38-40 synthase